MDNETRNLFSRLPIGSSTISEGLEAARAYIPRLSGTQPLSLDFGEWQSRCSAHTEEMILRIPIASCCKLGMVLERYADHVIEHVTSPLTGIQPQVKIPAGNGRGGRDVRRPRGKHKSGLLATAPLGPTSTATRPGRLVRVTTCSAVLIARVMPGSARKAKTADPAEFKFENDGIWFRSHGGQNAKLRSDYAASRRLDRLLREEPMGKLAALAERIAQTKKRLEAEADELHSELDVVRPEAPRAFDHGRAFIASSAPRSSSIKDTLTQLSKPPLDGSADLAKALLPGNSADLSTQQAPQTMNDESAALRGYPAPTGGYKVKTL